MSDETKQFEDKLLGEIRELGAEAINRATGNKEALLAHIAESGEQHLIKLRGDLAMVQGLGGIGPGVIAKTELPGVYKIKQSVMLNDKPMDMAFMFFAEDLLWASPAPEASARTIATPGNGGGLHIGKA